MASGRTKKGEFKLFSVTIKKKGSKRGQSTPISLLAKGYVDARAKIKKRKGKGWSTISLGEVPASRSGARWSKRGKRLN